MKGEFPINYGFKYNDEYGEWQKLIFNGILILTENSDSFLWEMSFCNDEDQLYTILIGDEDCIIQKILDINKSNSIEQFI